jgi:hypothetical protein
MVEIRVIGLSAISKSRAEVVTQTFTSAADASVKYYVTPKA